MARIGTPASKKCWGARGLSSHITEEGPPERMMPLGPSRLKADRKSTRLNSSHANISYAVFCLKKNKHTQINSLRIPKPPYTKLTPISIDHTVKFPCIPYFVVLLHIHNRTTYAHSSSALRSTIP